jgi:predicted DNA binding protein
MATGLTRDDRFLREVVVGSSHCVFSVDSSGAVVFSNGVFEGILGVEFDQICGERLEDLCAEGAEVLTQVREGTIGPSSDWIELTLLADDEQIPMVASCEATDFEGSTYYTLWCQEQVIERDVDAEIPAMEPRDHTGRGETTIEMVTEFVRDLLGADDPHAVAETGLEAAQRLLGTDVICIRFFDEEANALKRVATTDAATELLASRPAFDLNASLAGRAFRRDESVVDRPVESASGDLIERTNIHIPLGERGTLSVFESDRPLTATDRKIAEHLAAMVAADLTATEKESKVEDSDHAAFDLPVRDVIDSVIREETRAGIGRRVCERLAATGEFHGTWFVSTEVDGEWRTVEASAGDSGDPPEGVKRAMNGDSDDGPVDRAIETDDICVVRRHETVTNGDGDTGNDHIAHDEFVETTAVMPVSHEERTYGVLVVQSDSEQGLGPERRTELGVVGDIAGLAIYAAESKKLLLSEKVQEIEFEVTDRDCLAVAVSAETGGFCEVEHRTLTNDRDHLCYLQIDGAYPQRACETIAELGTVTNCRLIETGDNGCLFEVTKTQSGAEAMMDVGATVRRATAEDGVGTLVVDAPISADVREVVDAYKTLNPDSRLVAKQELDRPVLTADTLRESIDDILTEKQRSVLTSAYYAGYFDWPRANTAEEVADSLAISPATLHQHIRTAERKLLKLICEDEPRPRDRQPPA